MREITEITVTSSKAENGWCIDVRYPEPLDDAPYNKETATFVGKSFPQAYRGASTFVIELLLGTDEKGVIPLENVDKPESPDDADFSWSIDELKDAGLTEPAKTDPLGLDDNCPF